jgi:hypothetical protein
MKYGIYDTVDNCWIGNQDGPKLFDDATTEEKHPGIQAKTMAQMAAQVIETQVFGTDLGHRYEGREFNEKNLRLRDSVDVKLSGIDALKKLGGIDALKKLEGGE